MQRKTITTILISGNKIGVSVALKENTHAFSLLANVTVPHDGILEAEFLNETNFSFSISSALSKAEAECKHKISEAYVGVPPEFCSFETATHDVNLGSKKKVTPEILTSIFESATPNEKKINHTLLSCSTVSCKLDDELEVVSPVGHKAKQLKVTISYAYVSNHFLAFLNKCFKSYGLSTAIFVPMAVCEYVSLFEDSIREKGALFVNCNTLSTNLIFGKGDGVVKSFSFPVGVAHIVADVQEVFPLPYQEAEKLVHEIVLTALPSEKDMLQISNQTISLKMVWEIVNWRVNQMVKQICTTIDMFEENSIIVDTIYLTGDGISRIRGVKYHFEKRTNKKVEIAQPSVPRFAKPQFASQYAILKYSAKDYFKS